MKKLIVMKAVSYAKLQRRYGGKFIAREDGRVLASGLTYRQLLQAIRKRHLTREHLIVREQDAEQRGEHHEAPVAPPVRLEVRQPALIDRRPRIAAAQRPARK